MDNKVICSEEDLIAVADATRKKTGQTATMSLKEMANEINSMSYEGGEYVEQDPTVPDWAKQPNKPTYTAEEVGARPSSWIPEETDPTVPAWAKAENKPSYNWDEIENKPFTDGKLNSECLPDNIGTGGGTSGSVSTITLTSANNLNSINQCGWYS